MSQHLSGASPRVSLTLRAHQTIQRHFLRSVVRVSVLVASDLAAFVLLRGVMDLVRDQAVLGSLLAGAVQDALPFGYLGGWRFAAALFIGLLAMRNYGQGNRRRDAARLLAGVLLGTSLSIWQNLWVMGVARVTVQFAVTAGAFWVTLLMTRRGIDWIVNRVRAKTGQAEKVLFIGDPDDPRGRQIQHRLVRDGMVSLGWVLTNGKLGSPRLSSPDDIWLILQDKQADTVVLTGLLPEDVFQSVVEASGAAGCRTFLMPRMSGVGQLRPSLSWLHGIPFLELSVPGLTVPHLLLKRWIDLIGSLVALVVFGPVLLFVAVAIKLDSPGPVLYTQDRVGLGGRIFRVLKFRTMRVGADAEKAELAHLNHTMDPRLFKIPNDPRVTRLGAWLRRWSLDELPQLWNVLRGEMSLVGPRPFPLTDFAGYQEHHFLRLSAKPGITGLWQVEGRSDIVNFEEVVRMDRDYIERWSVGLDLTIIGRTLPAVFRRNGAY